MTTAAQNIHVLFRKSPLCRSHFFEWLKTAISSTACGTATLKSLLSQAFFVPDVHPRPRKHLSRCTLDCGFKTSESPALRGFVGERCPIRGTSLYLVLKSNGLHRSKNLPVKFGFSPKSTSTNIAKKLPLQRCFKPLLIALFNFSHKRPRSLSRVKVGTHSPFGEESHTAAHTPKHGRFGRGVVSLPSERFVRFGNPAWPGVRTAYFAAFGSWPGGALEERRKPSGQRCAYACRCPEGVAAPLGCVILLPLLVQPDLLGWKDLTKRSGRVTITRNDRTASRLALVQRLRWAVK